MRQENGRLAHVFARPRSRVGRHSGTGDWAGSDVPEPAGRGLLGMGDDLAASQGRRAAHAPAAGSGSGRSSASGVRLDSPARPARGRGPDARSPLSPLVPTRPPPQPPSQPPSQQTQQHARRRHVPQAASSSAAGVRRGLASGSDEENADEADAPSRQPAAAKKKQRTAKRPDVTQLSKDFIRSFYEATGPGDKRARFFTRPPGHLEKDTPFAAADWPQLNDFVAEHFRCGGAVSSGTLWRAQALVEPFRSRDRAANRSDTS